MASVKNTVINFTNAALATSYLTFLKAMRQERDSEFFFVFFFLWEVANPHKQKVKGVR